MKRHSFVIKAAPQSKDVCNRVDRQRKLERDLLFSGQFKDVLHAILDWLFELDLPLMKDEPVHGDLDTVTFLKKEHKNFEDEFNAGLIQVNQVRKTATEFLTRAKPEDAISAQNKVKQLNDSWNTACFEQKQHVTVSH
jgi:alpha-N-acetylglucosamine transferase